MIKKIRKYYIPELAVAVMLEHLKGLENPTFEEVDLKNEFLEATLGKEPQVVRGEKVYEVRLTDKESKYMDSILDKRGL